MTDAPVALFLAGDIRSSKKRGNITRLDLETILPFENQLLTVNITGKLLLQVLEHSVERYSKSDGRGEFLQMSGIRVNYDLMKKPGGRVSSVAVLKPNSSVPHYERLDPNQKYGVIVSSFLFGGGDGYTMFKVRIFHCFHLANQIGIQ